ncbi:MAG: SAM-dependent methyltransferase [Gemmatimonadota bacterium]
MLAVRHTPGGSLTVVGTGIELGAHLTAETRAHLEAADKLLYLVTDPVSAGVLVSLNPTAESLDRFYGLHIPRRETYAAIVEEILAWVRRGAAVCAAFYGHPGVFVWPSHEAIARARQEGYPARMLPAISAEDCLFADLGLDPARCGCQSFEATDFVASGRRFDPTALLLLWQVGGIGKTDSDYSAPERGLTDLVAILARHYPADHEVILYCAASLPVCEAVLTRLPLERLPTTGFDPLATLVVPPLPGSTGRG